MNAFIFEKEYLGKTLPDGKISYTSDHLSDMIQDTICHLRTLKHTNHNEFELCFTRYVQISAKKITSNSKRLEKAKSVNDKTEIEIASANLSGHNEMLQALKELNAFLYEKVLRDSIQTYKCFDMLSQKSRTGKPSRLNESKLTEENAKNLYHHLIDENWISRETPENDFIYYFTADCGTEPTFKLHWNAEAALLALVLTCSVKNRIPWKKLDLIFDNLPPNMRQTTSQKKNAQYYRDETVKINEWISSSN